MEQRPIAALATPAPSPASARSPPSFFTLREHQAYRRQEIKLLGEAIAALLSREPRSLRASDILTALGRPHEDPQSVYKAVRRRKDIGIVHRSHYHRYYHVSWGELATAYYTRVPDEAQ